MLKAFSDRCAQTLRRGDSLARLGGDEFVILLEVADAEVALETAKRILGAFQRPLEVGDRVVPLRPSIGISRFPECDSIESLIAGADEAMYAAKRGAGIASYTTHEVAHFQPQDCS